MNKQSSSAPTNSVTQLPIPLVGDINNRRFVTAVLAGVLGGAGVSAAANLLRNFRELRGRKREDTDDETIVINLPPKAAADGYTGMRDAKPGETKVMANGSRQLREAGRYGKKLDGAQAASDAVKCAGDGNPGPNSVGTIVANTLGLTAGGLISYEVVSRMFDAMNERRLKRKLRAAQQAYAAALSGSSKRAEAVLSVISPVEHAPSFAAQEKSAAFLDFFPDTVSNTVRYPAALYLLALLAGTGATAYVTKKVMDREFPEEKLRKDINRPTRVVFRTAGGVPSIMEGDAGQEKEASAETCAAITAMLPIYMDIVEGRPNRTLAAPYVKIAAAAGTDPAGLMKIAADSMAAARSVVMRDPKAVWEILKGTRFGLNFSGSGAADILRSTRPDTYRRAVDAAIDAHFAGGPNDGLVRRALNTIGRASTKAVAALGGRDMLVRSALGKKASLADILSSDTVRGAFRADDPSDVGAGSGSVDASAVVARVKRRLKGRRPVSVEAEDEQAARYVAANKAKIRRLLAKLNARGTI